MSDILSTRSLGEAAIHRTLTGTVTSPIATVVVADAALKLPNLSVGALITGVVTERAARGTVNIQTDKGSLTIQSNVALQEGNTVVLQLQSVGTQSRVVILSVNGQPIGVSEGSSESTNAAPQRTTTAIPPHQVDPYSPSASPGNVPDRPSLQTGIGSPPRPDHSSVAETAGTISATMPREIGGQRSSLTKGLVLPARVLEVPPAATLEPRQSALRSGDTLTVRVLALGQPGIGRLEPSVPPQAKQHGWLQGTIVPNAAHGPIGALPQGGSGAAGASDLVLATPQGRVALSASAPGPEGTRVLLEVIGQHTPGPESHMTVQDSQQAFVRFAREWSTLKEAAGALQPAGLEAARAALLTTIPAPGPSLASTILFFLTALKGGDFRGWMNNAATSPLEEIQGGRLLSRLSDDFTQLGRLASDSQPSGWQVMLIPIASGTMVEQIRMYYRQQKNIGEHDHDASGRFIVEAELKRFGVVQLDGLVQPKQFDLALRSDIQFTPDMQSHIRGIFQSALDIGGLMGAVRFESPSRVSVAPFQPDATEISHGKDVVI